MFTLASLRSDWWTTCPELVDDFIGMHNRPQGEDFQPQKHAQVRAWALWRPEAQTLFAQCGLDVRPKSAIIRAQSHTRLDYVGRMVFPLSKWARNHPSCLSFGARTPPIRYTSFIRCFQDVIFVLPMPGAMPWYGVTIC